MAFTGALGSIKVSTPTPNAQQMASYSDKESLRFPFSVRLSFAGEMPLLELKNVCEIPFDSKYALIFAPTSISSPPWIPSFLELYLL